MLKICENTRLGAHAPPSSGRVMDQATIAQLRYLIIPEKDDHEEDMRSTDAKP